MIRNLMSGNGFEGGAYGSEWFLAWVAVGIIIVLLFLCYTFFVKLEMNPFPFYFPGALIGLFLIILLISLGLNIKISFLIGLVGLLGGGIGLGGMRG